MRKLFTDGELTVAEAGWWFGVTLFAATLASLFQMLFAAADDEMRWRRYQYFEDAGCVRHAEFITDAYACFAATEDP